MTPFDLSLFVVAGLAAALIAGVAGFAFGLVAASIWLYLLTPFQATILIAVFGLVVQGYSVSSAGCFSRSAWRYSSSRWHGLAAAGPSQAIRPG